MATAVRPGEMQHSCELRRRPATPMAPQTRKFDQTKVGAFSPRSNIRRMADVMSPDVGRVLDGENLDASHLLLTEAVLYTPPVNPGGCIARPPIRHLN